MIFRIIKGLGTGLLWLVVALALAITFVPAFLDIRYYNGPASGHYDGGHFYNPDGEINFPVAAKGGRRSILSRMLAMQKDRPAWPDHVAVTPTRPPARVTGEAMRVTWVGHATVLVQAGGINILTDPIWSDYASPFGWAGIGPKRVAQPGVRMADLPRIDLILISHNHYDHMDLPTLQQLWRRDRPVIVTSLGNDSVIRGAGVPARALDWGQRIDVRGAQVRVMRNHHWSSRWGADRNRALWSAFLIATPAGNVFFAGDTGAGDMRWAEEARALGPIRLAILPIGAFRFQPGQMATDSHIGPGQAVEIFRRLDASMAVPIHWGTFRLSSEAYGTPPAMLRLFMQCDGLDETRFAPLAIGGARDVPAYAPVTATDGDRRPCAANAPEMKVLK